MSDPRQTGMSERQYERNKKARDNLERTLIDCGTDRTKAKETADKIARETDNKRRSEGK